MYYKKDDGSIDYVTLAQDLASMVHGYPDGEPPETLEWVAHDLKADPGSRHGRAMMAAAWASRWYTVWKITDVTLFDDLIRAAAHAKEVFDAAGCTAPGEHEHPEIADDDPEAMAGVVALIGDPEAWFAEDPNAEDEDIEALNCPAFLGRLATETVEDLQDARKERFEAPVTEPMDAHYLTEDGRTDLDVLFSDIERQKHSTINIDAKAQQAAVWAARRLIEDARPEERTPLALAVCHLADTRPPAAPGVAAVYREALLRFDLAPLDQPCPHPKGHPDVKARDTPRHARALISPVAEADEHGERCPRRVAERVREMVASITAYLRIEADPL